MPRDYRSAAVRRAAGHRLTRPRRHLWYARLTVAATILGVVGALIWLRAVLLPIVIALIIVYVLAPAVGRLQRWGIPRWLGVVLAYLTFFVSVYLFGYYLVPKLEHEATRLVVSLHDVVKRAPHYFKQFEDGVESVLDGMTTPEGPTPPPPASLRWGVGPALHGLPTSGQQSDMARLPVARFGPDASRRDGSVPIVGDETAARQRAASEAADKSSILISRLGDGEYGIHFNESSFEIDSYGEGRYNIAARAGRQRGSVAANLRDQIVDSLTSSLESIGGTIIGSFLGMLQQLIAAVIQALIGIIITFMIAAFILIDLDRLKRFLRQRIVPRYREDYDELLSILDARLAGVVRGQLLICVVNGVLSFAGFAFLIPQYAIVMAIFAGVMSLIPIFGTIISILPAALVGFTTGVLTAVGVAGWILLVHFIEANLLSPRIIGRQARIHPALVMFVIIAGQQMYGIVGALLAVPITALIVGVVRFAYPRAEAVIMRRSHPR